MPKKFTVTVSGNIDPESVAVEYLWELPEGATVYETESTIPDGTVIVYWQNEDYENA